MKLKPHLTFAISFFIMGVSNVLVGEEYRIWTRGETGKTLLGKIVSKDDLKETVELQLQNPLKTVVISKNSLSDKDKEYVTNWFKPIKPEDQLTVRKVSWGKNKTTVLEITVKTNDVKLRVLGKTIPPKSETTFTYNLTHETDTYDISLTDDNGNIVDRETETKKTGKTMSPSLGK